MTQHGCRAFRAGFAAAKGTAPYAPFFISKFFADDVMKLEEMPADQQHFFLWYN